MMHFVWSFLAFGFASSLDKNHLMFLAWVFTVSDPHADIWQIVIIELIDLCIILHNFVHNCPLRRYITQHAWTHVHSAWISASNCLNLHNST